jgi:hypothetical protein
MKGYTVAVVLVLFAFATLQLTSAKGFECKKDDSSSFLDIGESFTSFLQETSNAQVGNDAEFKKEFNVYKHKIKISDGGIGWDRLEFQTLDSKLRLKFKEVSDSLWALKFNAYNTAVQNKDASKVLTKMHKDMREDSCKKGSAALTDVALTLHNWKMKNFAKDKMYGSKKVVLKFKMGVSAHHYFDGKTGKWQAGDEKNVKFCIHDIDVESFGGKTFLMKLAGGLSWLLNPFQDFLFRKFIVPTVRQNLYCALIDSPPAFLTGLALAKKNAEAQKAILIKCLTPGACDDDFEPVATKKLLDRINGLKHGFESFGSLSLKNKGTPDARLSFDLKLDVETKSDSLFNALLDSSGKKNTQSVTEQTLQATQWISASSLSNNKKPKKGLTPVHELYKNTYTDMAKKIIKTFHADPKMAGMVQAGLDAVYDSQTDVNMIVNGKFGIYGAKSKQLSKEEVAKYKTALPDGRINFNAPRITLNAAIPHSDPMRVPFDLVLNTPIEEWDISGPNRKLRVSGLVGFNVSDALFIGPLTDFVDSVAAKAAADKKDNAGVIDRGNDILTFLLKRGAMVDIDLSGGGASRDGLHWNKNILEFHGRFAFDGPSSIDESLVYVYQQGKILNKEMTELAKTNNDRDKKTNLLLLQLVQKSKKQLVGPACKGSQGGVCIDIRKDTCAETPISGKCKGDSNHKCCVSGRSKGSGGTGLTKSVKPKLRTADVGRDAKKQQKDAETTTDTAPKEEKEAQPTVDTTPKQEASAATPEPEVTDDAAAIGQRDAVSTSKAYNPQDLGKILQWASSNPVEYGEDLKCFFEKKATSLIEEESETKKYEWFHYDVPQYELHQSGPNKGKYKCKSAEDKTLVPAYIFRAKLRNSVVGAKQIRIRQIDMTMNTEISKDGDELHIWLSNDKTASNSFEEHKAVLRKCEVSPVSKHFLPRISLKIDKLNWVYQNKDTMGYKGSIEVELRIGMALSFKRGSNGKWSLRREDVHSCIPGKGREFFNLFAPELGVTNIGNPMLGNKESFTVFNFNVDIRKLVAKQSEDGMYCTLKQQFMAKDSMIPHLLNALGNTKVAKDGRSGFKLSAGFVLDPRQLDDGRHKNLKVLLRSNFQMNSDVFVHALLNQVVGTEAVSKITKAGQAKDALTLMKGYAKHIKETDKSKNGAMMASAVNHLALAWFGEKHSYGVHLHGGVEYYGRTDDKPDWFKVKSDKCVIKGKTEAGHVLFNSLLLPMEAAKSILGVNGKVDPKSFTFGGGVEIGAKGLNAQGPANDMFDQMKKMVASTKQSELNKLRIDYVIKYLVNQGIDAHAYFGVKKKPTLPGFKLNKEEAVANVDLRFNGPADVAEAMNFFLAKAPRAKKLLEDYDTKTLKKGNCVV